MDRKSDGLGDRLMWNAEDVASLIIDDSEAEDETFDLSEEATVEAQKAVVKLQPAE